MRFEARFAVCLLLLAVAVPGWGAPLPSAARWSAKWIAAPWSTERDGAELDGSRPMPVFRREFMVRAKPVEAVLVIAGLGQYEAHLNGGDVAPAGLHQAWTDYRKTVTYERYEVTKAIHAGANVLGVMLGNGMYNVQRTKGRYTKFEGSFGVPKLIAELRLRYADGRTEIVATDATWKAERGPVIFSSTYGGEDYDARKLPAGWDRSGFDDAHWSGVQIAEPPAGMLREAIAPEVRVWESYAPVHTAMPVPGKTVYDLGKNFAGWPAVRIDGPAGAVLKVTPGELLKADGTVSQKSSGGPQWWSYTLRGGGEESWSPKFSYYGFRYLQVEWVGPSGQVLGVEGKGLHSASSVAGTFETSDAMLNKIHALILAAMHNNEMSLFTDCPHREKLGWLEETHLVASGVMYNDDLRGLFAATDRNMADAQHADGMVPTIAPQYTMFGPKYAIYDDSPEWGSASILAAWSAYRFYGDVSELERAYPTMQRYVAFLQSKAVDGIVAYGLGDWYDIGPGEPGLSKLTTAGVTGTLMLYEDAVAMQKIAVLLHKQEDARRYGELAEREKTAFNARFFHAAEGRYDTGSQTAQAMPLALGIVPESARAAVLEHLIADIHAHNDHVTAGEIGYPYLVRALMENGRGDVLLAMLQRTDAPSYGSQLAAGATALTEAWDANPNSSQDHLMLGGIEEWFYRGLAGIDFDLARGKDERITIRPAMVDGVDWVRASYESRLGLVRSEWRREAGKIALTITIPANATATVQLPRDAEIVKGARRLGLGRYRVGSGRYRFVMKE